MKKVKCCLAIANQDYNFSLEQLDSKIVHVVCESAGIDQEFLAEDIVNLLFDLEELIVAEEKFNKK